MKNKVVRPCLWCGSKLSLAGKHSFICENGYCVLTGHAMTYESWENAYCWKEIDHLNYKLKITEQMLENINKYR